MAGEKPCCPAAVARMVRKLTLPDGSQVGISNLAKVLKEVADLKLPHDKAIAKELLQRVKIHNYVAPAADNEYSEALLKEYKQQYIEVPKEGKETSKQQ